MCILCEERGKWYSTPQTIISELEFDILNIRKNHDIPLPGTLLWVMTFEGIVYSIVADGYGGATLSKEFRHEINDSISLTEGEMSFAIPIMEEFYENCDSSLKDLYNKHKHT